MTIQLWSCLSLQFDSHEWQNSPKVIYLHVAKAANRLSLQVGLGLRLITDLPACLNLTLYPFLSSVLTPLSTLHSAWYSVLPSFLSKSGTLCRSCQQIFCEAGALWSVCEWHKWIWKRAFWQWWMSVDCLECSGHLPVRLAMTSFIKCFDNARGSHSQELSCSN